MSNKPNRNAPAARARAATKSSKTTLWIVIGVILVVGVIAVVVAATGGSSSDDASGAAPAAVVEDVTSVPASAHAAVGAGTATSLPKPITGAEPLTKDGKPEVLYIGAEYCPYCAAERWALVEALSRFGTFSGLGQTTSASADVFPSTPTFTFVDSGYTSEHVAFTAVETAGNQPDGSGGYKKLETPTPAQASAWQKIDPRGSIPFVDIAGQYAFSGATLDPAVLQGKSMEEIAAAVRDPSTDISKAVLGAANGITAAICDTTANAPADVCATPTIKALQAQIKAQPAGGS